MDLQLKNPAYIIIVIRLIAHTHCRYAGEFHADKRRNSDEEMLAALDVNIPNYATAEGQKYTAS